jgi:hypothetical protein
MSRVTCWTFHCDAIVLTDIARWLSVGILVTTQHYNGIPDVTVWGALRKHLHLKAYNQSTFTMFNNGQLVRLFVRLHRPQAVKNITCIRNIPSSNLIRTFTLLLGFLVGSLSLKANVNWNRTMIYSSSNISIPWLDIIKKTRHCEVWAPDKVAEHV